MWLLDSCHDKRLRLNGRVFLTGCHVAMVFSKMTITCLPLIEHVLNNSNNNKSNLYWLRRNIYMEDIE